jgi:hypothetical protein
LREGVGGRGRASEFTDRNQNTLDISKHIGVGHSHDTHVVLRHPAIAHRIVRRVDMRHAIDLHDEPSERTV